VGVAGGGESPGAVYGFGDPDPGAGDDLRWLPGWRAEQEGFAAQVSLVVGEVDSKRLGQLAGAGAEVDVWLASAAGAHLLDSLGRLQGPDQDGGGLSLRFGDRVEEAVNSVGEVDVGVPGGAKEDAGPLGQADVGVAGRVVGLVALGLDDRAAAPLVEERAADQLAGNIVDRAIEELALETCGRDRAQARSSSTRAWTAASVSRASLI
jgi:hypothetical protein